MTELVTTKQDDSAEGIKQRQVKRDHLLAVLKEKHGPARPLTAEEQDALDTQIHNMNRMRKPESNQTG